MKPKLRSFTSLSTGTLCALTYLASACVGYSAEDALTVRVAPERDYLCRKGSREIVVEVEIQARRAENSRRSPMNVSVVLDRSGSMEGAKIEKARQGACAALEQLAPDDIFSFVVFDNEVNLVLPPERAGSREHRDELKERINAVRPGGSTALYAGVQMGVTQVRRFFDKERVNRVILLSDGIANVGPSRPRDLTDLGHRLTEDGLSVTTIGLGDDFNEDLMTGLAESSHANYYYVQDAEKLPSILTEEFNAASVRVAGEIRIRIEAPEGVHLREVIGHPEVSCKEQVAEIALPELFGSEHRLFHVRCAVDDSAAESHALAKVAVSYQDAASKQRVSNDQTTSVRLTDDAHRSDESVQNAVAQNVAVEQNRVTKEAAVKLADQGRGKEAAALLRSRAVSNAAAPAPQQMPGVGAENRKLETWANELAATGTLQNTSRKAAQWDNYQDKYQKAK